MSIAVRQATIAQDALVVEFTDEHQMIFVKCRSSQRPRPTGLEQVRLEGNGQVLTRFNSSHQQPVTASPFGFTVMAAGWAPAMFARYWQCAAVHLRGAFHERGEAEAFRFIVLGGRDFLEISAGHWNPLSAPDQAE